MSQQLIGRLEEVSVRMAWANEAHHFTPWLAENLDLLAEAIGIPLEIVAREVAVESFSADILARNPQDDSLVLIENQLEGSDHSHLGQIMTYLAGLDAQVIIWVATEFREAHLSALKWLNEHTEGTFAFFAIRAKAVRIGDSPLAPVFEVLCRPNEWERRLQSEAQQARGMSEIGQFRLDFWTQFVDLFPDEKQNGPANAASSRWKEIEGLGLVIVKYVGKTHVGVFIRSPWGVDRQIAYQQLEPYGPELASRIGIDFEKSGGDLSFSRRIDSDATNPSERTKMMEWLHATAEQYETVLRTILGDKH